MELVKRKICMITNWYPTKDNPYQGVFFREQALALGDYFDFFVVHYNEKKNESILNHILRKFQKKNVTVEKINEEQNITEYNAAAYFPKYKRYLDIISIVFHKCLKRFFKYHSESVCLSGREKRRKDAVQKIFKDYFENQIDVFYCVDAQYESFILQCAAESIHRPYIVSEHAPFPYPGNIISNIERNAMEHADLFMAISYDKIRQVLMQNINPRKFAYVGNLVDEKQFLLSKRDNEIKTFIMVAANSFYKNYNLFIDIFEQLIEITEKSFKVMVVGYGANKGYSKNAAELEERIIQSKFGKNVELIPEISHDRIQELYSRADAFVMTSIQEGMPVSALEAGCCGLPIFSTMCGGVEDYVEERIGRIYGIVDSTSFAKGLKEYLEGEISFDNEYIRNYIVEKFGKKAFTNRMVNIFNETIDNFS